MPWLCTCGIINSNLNKHCSICKVKVRVLTAFDEDESLLIKCQIYRLNQVLRDINMDEYEDKLKTHKELFENGRFDGRKMTPIEEKHSKLFFHEKKLVIDMDDLTLRSHREELSSIAFEARVRLSAADDEISDRRKKGKKFLAADVTEDITSDAISKIAERAKKISKDDEIERFLALGIDRATAQKIVKAEKQIDAQVKMGIDRESAEKAYAPILKIVEQAQAEQDKRIEEKKAKLAVRIVATNRTCPECSYNKFSIDTSGDLSCPDCKTLLTIPKAEPIESKLIPEIIQAEPKPKQIFNPFAKKG
jgi:hypothetical protein